MKSKIMFRPLGRVLALALCLLLCPVAPVSAASDDATLSSLYFEELIPLDFASDTYSYTAVFPYDHSTGSYKVPELKAAATDPAAGVDIHVPEGLAAGDVSTPITVTVTAEAGNEQIYEITPVTAGGQLYANGGGELDSSVGWWTTGTGQAIVTETAIVAEGSKAIKIHSGAYRYWNPTGGNLIYPEVNETYLSSYQVRLAPNEDGFTTGTISDTIDWMSQFGGTLHHWALDGTSRTASTTLNLNEWQELPATFHVTVDRSGESSNNYVSRFLVSWGAAPHFPILFDDYFLGKLVINKVTVTDAFETGVMELEKPESGTATLALKATLQNQLGNQGGVANTPITWSLAEAYTGVSVNSSTGVLSVDSTAIEGDVTVIATASPDWVGAEQAAVIGRAAVTVKPTVDRSGAELLDIRVGDFSVPDFSPAVKNYNVKVPYVYQTNSFDTVPMPEVTVLPRDAAAAVDIVYPDTVEGGTVTITVENGEVMNTYQLHLSTVGTSYLTDGGFETTDVTDTSSGTSTRVTEEPKGGSYHLQTTVAGLYLRTFRPAVKKTTAAGHTYLFSGYVKGAEDMIAKGGYIYTDVSQMINAQWDTWTTMYTEDGAVKNTNGYIASNQWTQAITVLRPTAAASPYISFAGSREADFYTDEMYFSDLTIAKLRFTGEVTGAAIPETAGEEVVIPLSAEFTNALGNTCGLENEKVTFETAYDYDGVRIENNKLIITQDAQAGTVIVRMTVNPTFTSEQGKVTGTVYMNLRTQAEDAAIPKARYVTATRDAAAEDYVLSGSYSYYHALGVAEGATRLQWLYSAAENGVFSEIAGATGLTYTVPAQQADGFLCLEVTPVAADGTEGDAVRSNIIRKPEAPAAADVKITGVGAVGETYTGSYTYNDKNGDAESGSTYRWLISDSQTDGFAPIDGATGLTYVVQAGDAGKYLRFEVTPRTNILPTDGEAYLSPAVLAATTPVAGNVRITKNSNTVYSVSYQYSHPLGVREGVSKIEWFLNGASHGTGSMVTLTSNAGGTLSVTVTPVAEKAPFEGAPVTASVSVSASTTTVGRGSSGGRGGSSGGSAIVPLPEIVTEPEPEVVAEPEKHWAADGIAFVLERGIMQNLAPEDFGNSQLVTRADFVYYIMKTLGEPETAYAFEFGDVSGSDYFAGALQTAVNMGIISRDENFYPYRNVSREEICKILVTAMGMTASQEPDLSKFTDNGDVAEWARGYVAAAVETGLLKGVSETEFLPRGMVTREQTAVIAKRLYDYKNGGVLQ